MNFNKWELDADYGFNHDKYNCIQSDENEEEIQYRLEQAAYDSYLDSIDYEI